MSWLMAKDWATGVEYSTLFHSGLRAISLRKPRPRTYSSSSSSQESDSSGRTPSGTPLPPSLFRRSMRPPSPSISMSTESSSASQPCIPKVVCRQLVEPLKEAAHAWTSEENFFDRTLPEEENCYGVPPIEIDGVHALPGSRSFFMSVGKVEGVGIQEESILLLSSSPDMFLHRPDPQCECPMSMHMSLPPRCVRETRRNGRGDCAWMLEESSPEPKEYEFEFEEAIQLDDEPGDMADWRQFHVNLLATIPSC